MAEIHPNDIGLATYEDVGDVAKLRTVAGTVVDAINEIRENSGGAELNFEQLYVEGEDNIIIGKNNIVYGNGNMIIGSNNLVIGNNINLISNGCSQHKSMNDISFNSIDETDMKLYYYTQNSSAFSFGAGDKIAVRITVTWTNDDWSSYFNDVSDYQVVEIIEHDAMINSLSAQISYYSEYIQSCNEWEYAGVYADEAISGTKDSRPEFQRMIADCKTGKIDMIITKSISRFARNTVTLLETVRELKTMGVDVYFEKENIHSMSGDGELMLTILASFAQEESLSVSENCKWRIRNNYEEGIPNGFTIYGYDIKNRKMTVNEEQANVVRSIFDMYLVGIGSNRIAKYLNENNIPSPKNSVWNKNVVIGILKNEKYIGDLLLQKFYSENHISKRKMKNDGMFKQYYVTDNHEPIISRDDFEKVQKIIKDKSIRNPHVEPYDYRFKGIVFCSECGKKFLRKLVRNDVSSKRYVWKCNTYMYKGKECCSNKQIPDEILITLADGFDKEISKIIVHPDNEVQFVFTDGSEESKKWEINRRWSDKMKEKNYYNQRRRHLKCQEQ